MTTAATYQRVRRQQLLREAEGYLDLMMVFADQWPLRPEVRDPLGQRVLATLDQIDDHTGRRAHKLYLRGQTLRAMLRFTDAIVALKESAEIDPENVSVWLALGWCYKRSGRLDLAIQSLEDAMNVDPNQGIIYYNLACYWALAKNVKLTVAYLTRAFDLDANYRDLIANERDFDLIREHRDFQSVVSLIV
ncbi:MAG TPA: tetratricopeptide repeat protein [Pirellulaceae bacterium]|nr:tetratricopeptide repeat protein [Pirellulaceae bacterium]